jgi:hypothetical protein
MDALEPTPFFDFEPAPTSDSAAFPFCHTRDLSSFMDDPFHQRLMNIAVVETAQIDDPTDMDLPSIPETTLLTTMNSQYSITNNTSAVKRSRKLKQGQWNNRFQELLAFKRKYGHMYVPNSFVENPQLSQWVKRQRYQHKLKVAGKHSTLNNERQQLLDKLGFIWDSHASFWHERLQDLKEYRKMHGHCNVPVSYSDISLSFWVKHQRRQYNRSKKGMSSTMTEERIAALNALGIDWNPRNLKD